MRGRDYRKEDVEILVAILKFFSRRMVEFVFNAITNIFVSTMKRSEEKQECLRQRPSLSGSFT